jgi:hypothetical protein
MEAISRLVPEGFPVSLQVVAGTLILGIVYSLITKDRPFAGFPIITLDGKSAKQTWLFNGKRAIAEGVKKVCDSNRAHLYTRDRLMFDAVRWAFPSHHRNWSQNRLAKPIC